MTTKDPAMLLGHDSEGQPIHLGHDELVRHTFVAGATGSGKTNQLLAMAASAVSGGNGLIFVDGKGDLSAYRRILTLARRFGREGDVRLLNFCERSRNVDGLVTNTFNPFATGSAETLTQFVIGMMDDAGGDGAMWRGRATAMFTGVMRALVHLRDEGLLALNVGAIRDHLNLRKIIDLSDPEKYTQIPADVRHSIRSYLCSLPGYQEEKKYKQAMTTLDQHGYLEMQFTRVLGSFGDVYDHVFSRVDGEVEIEDLRDNRRILVVLLPMIGRSADERRFLGSTVQAILNGMMSSAVKGRFGPGPAIVATPPHVVMLDEFSTFATPGMEVLATQGRSLGFAFVFATQTLVPSAHDPEGHVLDAILANTATKILMRTDLIDHERFSRILPRRAALAQDDTLNALKDRMATIQGLLALHAQTGGGREIGALAEEYVGLARGQKVAFAERASLPSTADLQALPTGAMIVLQAGASRQAYAYDLSGLPEADPQIVGHLPVNGYELALEVRDCVDDMRSEIGLPTQLDATVLAQAGGVLQALEMLPKPDESIPAPDLVRLSVAICAAAGEE